MLFFAAIFSVFLFNSAFAEVLLLGLGFVLFNDNIGRDQMDAVNIDDAPGSYCSPLTSFPKSGGQAAGGLVNGRIVVCGGYFNDQSSSECYASGANSWELIGNLTYPKYDHAAATLPNGDLWVTGGTYEGNEHSTDIITTNMEILPGPDIASAKSGHCVTQFNRTTMILIGGFEDPHRADFFNVETQEWAYRGPPTRFSHAYAGCVSFTDTDGKDKVIVIGDYYTFGTIKAEIFDGVSWEVLDNLPVTMSYANAVLYKDKVIVTGEDYDQIPLPTSWEFDINTRTWAPGFPMNPPISKHISFLLPDSFCP